MFRAALLAALAAGPLVVSGCDLVESSDECGLLEANEVGMAGSAFLLSAITGSQVLEGKRSFWWDVATLENLCVAAPEAENRVEFTLTFAGQPPSNFNGFGRVQPAYLYQPYESSMAPSGTNSLYVKISGIGLAQGSQDGKHGYADIRVMVEFPTQGSEPADRAYLVAQLASILVKWHFEALGATP
jgi:hypothetical protein